jgi:superfamily II DNA or RNA helicase
MTNINNFRKGYLYFREHESYNIHNAGKLGISECLSNRDITYATGEIIRGIFKLVIEINYDKMRFLEKLLQNYFKSLGYHIYINGGTEFYNYNITDSIVEFMSKTNIEYKILSNEEINNLLKEYRLNKICEKYKLLFIKTIKKWKHKKQIEREQLNSVLQPHSHQKEVLDIINDWYSKTNIGKIIWGCGLGKALLCLFIIKQMNFKSVVIGVPSNYLQKQMIIEILKLFPNKNNILCVGGNNYNSTTNLDTIKNFLKNKDDNIECKFIITTYASCYLLTYENVKHNFDFKVGDEAHHLVGFIELVNNEDNIEENEDIEDLEIKEEKKKKIVKIYKQFHNIKSSKTLFMTATEKIINNSKNNNFNILYSMDDVTLFGECINFKTIGWAIDNKKITDYKLLVIKNTLQEVNSIIQNLKVSISNKDLFFSAFMTLKSIEKYDDLTHVLIYTNSIKNAIIVKQYIDLILDTNKLQIDKTNFYNKELHSKTNTSLEIEIETFRKSKYGIIPCVYIFGEGFDLPTLNGITYAENMVSPIRMVQCGLRPNRLDKEKPNKIAYLLIPYLETEKCGVSTNSFEHCRDIIYKMRNVDEKIEHKIIFGNLNIPKINPNLPLNPNPNPKNISIKLEENHEELLKLKLRLKYSKSLLSSQTEEQDEYDYIKSLNKEMNFISPDDYKNRKEEHQEYFEEPKEHFTQNGVWTNWYDFLGINTNQFIKTKKEWVKFCTSLNITSIEDYFEKCKIYNNLSTMPEELYIGYTNISNELELLEDTRRY